MRSPVTRFTKHVILYSLAPVLASALVAAAAAAQGTIAGVVRDSTGASINGVQIFVAGSALKAESGVSGGFAIHNVPEGPVSIRIRRIGFVPVSVPVVVTSGAMTRVRVTISALPQQLPTVTVRAAPQRRYEGYLAGFHERRDRGFGHFITGDEIAKQHPSRMSEMLRMIPGLRIYTPNNRDSQIRFRGNTCWPSVWIDGAAANSAEFDMDWLLPSDIAGIEIYSSAATVPQQFVDALGPTTCGTIVVWTFQGEPRKKKSVTAAQLADLVGSLKVYTVDAVDTPARYDSATSVQPVYPESLYKAGIGGRVLAEMVVDTEGHPEPQTIGMVSSSDRLFATAVATALTQARFVPARIAGHAVRQVVLQPFTFVAPRTDAATP